ncbi:MAG: hypothetical protein P4L56_13815 [Candidatus Sulfopaludibacter sp.]|nr:hypothetical protein [Candidatus Sulfopaludibacter sp.]
MPFTITLSGTAGGLSGTITLPTSLLLGGGSGTGSATITGGTGNYSGATGSFPSLAGTGSLSLTSGAVTVTFSGAGSITVGGGGSTVLTPVITDVLDAGGYTSNISQGSIFVVKGSNLSASGYNASGFPLLTSYSNVSITFTPTSGGTGTNAYMVYTYNQGGVNQLAAVLPSTLAAGNYNVTVTNSGSTSLPFVAQVVKTKPGIISQDSTGTGLAVAQNYISQSQLDINRFTTGSVSGITISPAKPGQTLIAWGTGLGAVTGGDNVASAGYNFAANGVNVQVIVGGMSITPFYAGRAPGLAGADQIDFTLPSNVPTGCTVSFQVSVGGVTSNATFIAIAPDANSSACVQPGFTTTQLQNFDQGGSYTTGSLAIVTESGSALGQSSTYAEASGEFSRYTGFQLSAAPSSSSATSFTSGSCIVSQVTTGQTTVVTTPRPTSLDAGAITLTGPPASGLNNQALTKTTLTVNSIPEIVYTLPINTALPGAVSGSIVAGTYTMNGAGGKDIGPFSAQVTLGAPLAITGGLPATVVRSAGMTLNWTGGNANDFLEIIGSSDTTANGVTTGASFICLTTVGPGTFTVPASILTQLPAGTISTTGSSATSLAVTTGTIANFTAPLTAGGNINFGVFTGVTGISGTPAFQ